MTLRKNVSGAALVTPFVDGEVEDGQTVETPDVQADGSPLIWDPAYWQAATPHVRSRRNPAPSPDPEPAPEPEPEASPESSAQSDEE